jgi:NAD(P)-dependent dehydrogenase (short-subunit alcohol dehydrogenase family)
MNLHLKGKRALITGGSRGLGRAIAGSLALEGCNVAIAARTESSLIAAADDIRRDSRVTVEPVILDMMDLKSIQDCVERTVHILGGLDILVNCAARTGGTGEEADVYRTANETTMIADFTEKVVGSLRLASAAEPHLRAAGGGRIVLFSGGAGRIRGGLISAGARNRAINNLTLSLANALGQYGIGVICVSPGGAVTERQLDAHRRAADQTGVSIDTYMSDRAQKTTVLRRLVMAQDLADVVTFLCSPLSWPINAANIELAGGSSPDVHYELPPHPPWEPGLAQ